MGMHPVHPEWILNNEMLIQKAQYIHYNPVRRGLVEMPEHWLYSSSRNYLLNDHSVIQIDEMLV